MGGGKELIAHKEIECKYQLSSESSEELKPELAERRKGITSMGIGGDEIELEAVVSDFSPFLENKRCGFPKTGITEITILCEQVFS